jgi:hypothetical protein
LERRVLLDGDPVIVLTEAVSLREFSNVTAQTVRPRLWENPQEFLWDLELFNSNTHDGDGNGYPDDAYGWNFSGGGSPNFINNTTAGGGHGAAIMGTVLETLAEASSQGDRVRVMYVIGPIGSQIVDYVLWHKAHGVNIVAVSNSTGGGGIFTREDAEMLRDEGILMFVGRGNTPPTNRDSEIGDRTSWPFYHATPRWGIQEPAVHTIIPVTTDPEVWQTDYGVNSFYFGAPGTEEQSYAAPRAAALAAIAVEAYQEFPGHNGQSPTAQQIKRAMMSGVEYIPGLDDKTITHDYVGGERRNGGRLKRSQIVAAINQTAPQITGVSMEAGDPVGTTVEFNLNRTGAVPTNWTISLGR